MKKYLNRFFRKPYIYTIYGTFLNGIVTTPKGEYIGISYKIFKEEFNNCTGFFNMVYDEPSGMWKYIQGFKILDENILEKMK